MRVTAGIVECSRRRGKLGLVLLLLLVCGAWPLTQTRGQSSGSKQTQKDMTAMSARRHGGREIVLRKRVQDFYGLLQLGHWDQAESFIAPDSLENFRKQPRGAFLGFEVQSVSVAPTGEAGMAVVDMRTMNSLSPMPVAMPQTSRWRWINGDWYLEVPNPADQGEGFKALFDEPKETKPTASRPEDLKFKGHRYRLGMVRSGEVRVAHFPFTNVTDHPVTLSSVNTFCDCLQAKIDKKEFKPGESGELDITFDPKGFQREYSQSIIVKTDPGDLTTYLTVMGFVVTDEAPSKKRVAKAKPSS
jgi:uncharacterized protein DUF1573